MAECLFSCVDELLALSQAGWLRKHVHALLRRLLAVTSYDLSVDAWLVQLVDGACSEASLTGVFSALRRSVWDRGCGEIVSGGPRTEAQVAQRAQACHDALQTVLARPSLILLLRKAGCSSAAERIFEMLQNKVLNRHLVLSAIDLLLSTIFPDLAGADEAIEQPGSVVGGAPGRSASEAGRAREEALEQALLEAIGQVETLTNQVQRLQGGVGAAASRGGGPESPREGTAEGAGKAEGGEWSESGKLRLNCASSPS